MNQLTSPDPALSDLPETVLEEASMELAEAGEIPQWELKKLRPMHKQICALIAQGHKYVNIAPIVGCTPEYISMLMRQPLIKAEVDRISSVAMVKMNALTDMAVEVTRSSLTEGSEKGKLQAARMVFETTGRLGRGAGGAGEAPVDMAERLLQLSERLVEMNAIRPRRIYDELGQDVTEVKSSPSK